MKKIVAIDDVPTIEDLAENHPLLLVRQLQQTIRFIDRIGPELEEDEFPVEYKKLSRAAGLLEEIRDRFAVLR